MCTCLHEGIAATRVADCYNDKITNLGHEFGPTGCVMVVDTGEQCTVAGCGPMFEQFLWSGKIKNYTGYGEEPTRFYEDNFDKSPFRIMKFDQTFDKMPYDCRKSEFHSQIHCYKAMRLCLIVHENIKFHWIAVTFLQVLYLTQRRTFFSKKKTTTER